MIIKEPKVVSSTYISLPLTTNEYKPETKTGNHLKIAFHVNDNYFYYKAFNNDTLKLSNRGLKIFNSYKGNWEEILKVSNTINIFSRYNDGSKDLNSFR